VAAHGALRTTRRVEAGFFASFSAGRRGRATSSPPQFGHRPFNTFCAHSAQNVHSNEQIRACADSGGRSRSQHSQFGRSSSIARQTSFTFFSGRLRTGLPVAAWIAFSTAGVTTQIVGSPTPPQKS